MVDKWHVKVSSRPSGEGAGGVAFNERLGRKTDRNQWRVNGAVVTTSSQPAGSEATIRMRVFGMFGGSVAPLRAGSVLEQKVATPGLGFVPRWLLRVWVDLF